jgi:hypothetical protein
MNHTEFLRLVQYRVANVAIGPSTLRNQGASGVNNAARGFLASLDLGELSSIVPADYPKLLARWTDALVEQLPTGARKWGTARKAINVFMVEVFLNRFLAEEYDLDRFGDVLETPLDSEANKEMKRLGGQRRLPGWYGIVRLTPADSEKFQSYASFLAAKHELRRATLDLILWRHFEASPSAPPGAESEVTA